MSLSLALKDDGTPEVFLSVQGEGRHIGQLRTFIRLSCCNLHCVWCDTAYTWNWVGTPFAHERDQTGQPYKFERKEESRRLENEELIALVRSYAGRHMVVTGGEPMLQRGPLAAFMKETKSAIPGASFEIETNGSMDPGAELLDCVDLFMVSPKLRHSGNAEDIAIKDAVLRQYVDSRKAFFKFVVQTAADFAEIESLCARIGIPSDRVYIMPKGTSSAEITATGRAIVNEVIVRGYHYSDRLHVHLFGDLRGV